MTDKDFESFQRGLAQARAYLAKPTGNHIHIQSAVDRVMARHPRIMTALRHSELSEEYLERLRERVGKAVGLTSVSRSKWEGVRD